MKLFDDLVPVEKQHAIYRKLKLPEYEPERRVLQAWSSGFVDRDGKFCREFQTTFEACLWELYIHAYLKEVGVTLDFSHHAPDFVATSGQPFCIEATIAAPPAGGKPAFDWKVTDLPEDLNAFNRASTLRIANSFTSKAGKYRLSYANHAHVRGRPFVIAIASFDRPFAHLSASRPIMSALYGLDHDEELTISTGAGRVISYNVGGVEKVAGTSVPLGYFTDQSYSDVSAVIYSSLATWGKLRALADNPGARSVYTTFHPNLNSILPLVRNTPKASYHEHLLDGLYVFHNPFAKVPLNPSVLAHPRLAQFVVRPDGDLDCLSPDDFLLSRFVSSVSVSRG